MVDGYTERELESSRRYAASGSNTVDEAKIRRVEAVLGVTTERFPMTRYKIADAAGVSLRMLHAIFGEYDADRFLLGSNNKGTYLVRNADEAEAFTDKMETGANTTLKRVARRRAYAQSKFI